MNHVTESCHLNEIRKTDPGPEDETNCIEKKGNLNYTDRIRFLFEKYLKYNATKSWMNAFQKKKKIYNEIIDNYMQTI